LKFLLFIFITTPLLFASLMDDSLLYDEGKRYVKEKEYKKAIAIFESLAQKPYDKVQYDLALLYEQGLGTPQDYNKSLHWFTKSAENKNRDALNFLAQKYYNGWGVDANKTKAKELLIKSKDLNSTTAKLLLKRYKLNE
jgi:TPR repeat protein